MMRQYKQDKIIAKCAYVMKKLKTILSYLPVNAREPAD